MDTENNISWEYLIRTIEYFKSRGYKYIEVPWLVSNEAIRSTFNGPISEVFQNKYVVGSGEQSFVQLQLDGKLPIGKYVTLTPCFRDEIELSDIKQLSFMKVELYDFRAFYNAKFALMETIKLCETWFNKLQDTAVNIVRTGESEYDINLHGIEIGSYGIRTYNKTLNEKNECHWIYATGLAEPRFSTVVNKNRK